jgi:transposase
MHYVGIDLHKETSWFYVLDSNGRKVISKNVSNSIEELKLFFQSIPKPFQVAVETTYNWYFMIDLAEEYAKETFLANSYELKAFAKRNKKTDKIDAKLIATVLYQGYLPTVTIPNKYTRELREFLNYRLKTVVDRSRNIFRLKALMDKLGIISSGDFTTYKALNAIETEGLSEMYAAVIHKYRDRITYLTKALSEINSEIARLAQYDFETQLLITVPGIGSFSALLIKIEIIDINRFRSFSRLCSYAGLAPKVSASANKLHHGPLNKNRRKNLQWILLENVIHFVKADPARLKSFEALKKRKGYNTAKVVFARKMLCIIYHVLKEQRPYSKTKIQSVEPAALRGV